jgi:hypothetical protein
MSCGLAPSNGNKFCRNCGADTHPEAIVCVKCGAQTGRSLQIASTLEKVYLPFLVALAFLFGFSPLLLVTAAFAQMSANESGALMLVYLVLVVVAIGLSVSNFIAAQDNRFGTKPLDLFVMIFAFLGLACVVGISIFTQMIGCALTIVAMMRYFKHR